MSRIAPGDGPLDDDLARKRRDQPADQGLMPSLLDRLIDAEADGSIWRRGYGLPQMIAAVHRDLEDLLNTRSTTVGVPIECKELRRSVAQFGLPDLSTIEAITADQRGQIGRILEQLILLHEPRLKNVKATLMEGDKNLMRNVRFRIEARLAVDPAPEVAFDTILELTTGHSTVKRTGV